MNRKHPHWLRLGAALLALAFAGESTGAAAAVIVATQCPECCGQPQEAQDCAAQVCTITCGSFCVALVQESAVAIDFAAPGGRWAAVDESGSVRPAKPPVPPPRV